MSILSAALGQYSSGVCPEVECNTKLLFPSYEKSVECTSCGRRHNTEQLVEKKRISNPKELLHVLRTLLSQARRDKGDQIVKGISDYQCKLLSPYLTSHGMKDRKAVPLRELGQSNMFDCSKLSDRAFAIEERELGTEGYGRDRSGSATYLKGTLELLNSCSNGEERLVPLHVDGDGHCLVHAISRCLVGRELFWHPLRTNLQTHLEQHLEQYKNLCRDFIDESDWPNLIKEAGPDYAPEDDQPLGLTNVHLFGLANVLKRPIVLLDGITGMQSSGDYAGIFLPILHEPSDCVAKDKSLNQPIVIGWSSKGHNHYIPLVAIKDRPLPRIPPAIQPQVWGVSHDRANHYLRYDSNGLLPVAGGKAMSDKYLKQLVDCMDDLFYQENKVRASLVSDVNRNVYRSCGYITRPRVVIEATKEALNEQCLWRCLICNGVTLLSPSWFRVGGELYNVAKEEFPNLLDGHGYFFPACHVMANYRADTDSFTPFEVTCKYCDSKFVRKVSSDNTIQYDNGDRTSTPSTGSRCNCGYKHYWDGREYDNLPVKIPLSLSWKGRTVTMEAYWFQHEISDPSLNSNAYDVARQLVNKHFPGDFGEDQLVHQVVETILTATATKETEEEPPSHEPDSVATSNPVATSNYVATSDNVATSNIGAHKTIITGPKGKSLHKEELTMSQAERDVHHRIKTNAPLQQRHASNRMAKTMASQDISKTSHKNIAQDTTSKILETTGDVQDTKPEKKAKPSLLRIKVTMSDNSRQATLTIDASSTFEQLQEAILENLNVPPRQQRLRCGFPPRVLHAPSDSSQPLNLANGDRILVDIISDQSEQPQKGEELEATPQEDNSSHSSPSESEEAAATSIRLLQSLLVGKPTDLWPTAQHNPMLFKEGGEVYEMAKEGFGEKFKDGTHFTVPLFPDKVFRVNQREKCLELCLGLQHIPIRPLTDYERERSYAIAHPDEGLNKVMLAANDESVAAHLSQLGGYSGAINRQPQQKAFSGKGHTLSSASDSRKDTITRAALKLLDDRLDQLTEEADQLKTSLHEDHGYHEQGGENDVKDNLMAKLQKVQQEIKQLKNEKLKFEQMSSPG